MTLSLGAASSSESSRPLLKMSSGNKLTHPAAEGERPSSSWLERAGALTPTRRCWSPPQQSASSRTALRRTGRAAGPAG